MLGMTLARGTGLAISKRLLGPAPDGRDRSTLLVLLERHELGALESETTPLGDGSAFRGGAGSGRFAVVGRALDEHSA